MPIFNYLTSEGKSLIVNTDSLNNDCKEKIKTYIKEDLVKKESLSAQETEMQMDPVGITDADSEGREKFDDIATTLGFRQFYYGGKGGYHEASGSFLYHGLANIAGVGMTDLDKKKARQEIYTEDDGDRDNLFEKGQKITYDFLKDAQDYQLKAAKKVKENNSMKNKCWCVPKNLTDTTRFNIDKRVFDVNNIPVGWIQITEARDKLKNKTGSYGKFWIYNPTTKENKYTDGKIPEGWYKGRKMEYYQKSND